MNMNSTLSFISFTSLNFPAVKLRFCFISSVIMPPKRPRRNTLQKKEKTKTQKRSPLPSPRLTPKEEEEEEEEEVVASAFKSPVTVGDIEDFAPEEVIKLRHALLLWYDDNKRTLPWRNMPATVSEEDRAYAVWVSEVMLQQTRVAAVVGYYQKWMERWPTVYQLAGATQEEVNEMWAGLGYYRRARFLLEGAKSVVETGNFPRTAASLRDVRGIGNYTAGAIASIAFNEAVPLVDGNVIRVITRLKAISSSPKESTTLKGIWKLSGQLVDPCRPGDFNQALMELGATLCSSTSPSCSTCPISVHCHALALSKASKATKVTDYPVKILKPKQKPLYAAVCIVEIAENLKSGNSEGGGSHKLILVKRPEKGLLAGLWEFPTVLINEENTDESSRRKTIDLYLKRSFNIDLRKNCNLVFREDVGEYVHIFSHIRLQMHVELLILSLKGGMDQLDYNDDQDKLTWKCVEEESIQKMGLTSGVRKVYNMTKKFKEKNCQSLVHHGRVQSKKIKIDSK